MDVGAKEARAPAPTAAWLNPEGLTTVLIRMAFLAALHDPFLFRAGSPAFQPSEQLQNQPSPGMEKLLGSTSSASSLLRPCMGFYMTGF